MDESQVALDYQGGKAIRFSLSEDRFSPYLRRAGYLEQYAFNLYLYNVRLSEAFLFPLHILEVSLRNHISAIFSSMFGASWLHESRFRSVLTQESLTALDKGIERAKSNETNDVVATLTFDFWSNLFRPEYDRHFWQINMGLLLPNAQNPTRKEFQKTVRELNGFRNRIAHHEPIHKINISAQHTNIIETIGLLCKETADWVKSHSTVNQAMRTKPSKNGEVAPFFRDRCDKSFEQLLDSTRLSELPYSKFILCRNRLGELLAVVEERHIARYLLALKENDELMIDLNEHKISQLIDDQNLYKNYSICGGDESLSKAHIILRKGMTYIVVKDSDVLGVIAKAHRNY